MQWCSRLSSRDARAPPPRTWRGPRVPAASALVLSDQARRYLTLQYSSYSTEFMGCLIGDWSGRTVVVRRIAPADADPVQSTGTHVLPR